MAIVILERSEFRPADETVYADLPERGSFVVCSMIGCNAYASISGHYRIVDVGVEDRICTYRLPVGWTAELDEHGSGRYTFCPACSSD